MCCKSWLHQLLIKIEALVCLTNRRFVRQREANKALFLRHAIFFVIKMIRLYSITKESLSRSKNCYKSWICKSDFSTPLQGCGACLFLMYFFTVNYDLTYKAELCKALPLMPVPPLGGQVDAPYLHPLHPIGVHGVHGRTKQSFVRQEA